MLRLYLEDLLKTDLSLQDYIYHQCKSVHFFIQDKK